MNLYTVSGILGIVVLGVVLNSLRKKRRKKKTAEKKAANAASRRQQFVQLVRSIPDASDTSVDKFSEKLDEYKYELWSYKDVYLAWLQDQPELSDRFTALVHVLKVRSEDERRKHLRGNLEKWQDESRPMLNRLADLFLYVQGACSLIHIENVRSYSAELDIEVDADTCQPWYAALNKYWNDRLISTRDELGAKAEDSADSFRELKALHRQFETRGDAPKLTRSPEWNKWVVKHNAKPEFDDFAWQGAYGYVEVGTVSLRMQAAIVSRDLVELAIVLAYCYKWKDCRHEVGDVLYADAVRAYDSQRETARSELGYL